MIENEKVKKAEEELEYLSGDEAERRIAYLRETAEIDRKFAMTAARDQGRAEGKIEEKIETAKKMLAEEMDINLIIKIISIWPTQNQKEKRLFRRILNRPYLLQKSSSPSMARPCGLHLLP